MSFSVSKFDILGPLLIQGVRHTDERGYFSETYQSDKYKNLGLPEFVQDNLSLSKKGVFRGLHWQMPPFGQGKLVTCVNGSIIDYFVDIREESPTYLKYCAVALDSKELKSLWIPEGFAHGFLSLENDTLVSYKVTNFWNGKSERVLNPDFLSGDERFRSLKSKIISSKDSAAKRALDEPYPVLELPT